MAAGADDVDLFVGGMNAGFHGVSLKSLARKTRKNPAGEIFPAGFPIAFNWDAQFRMKGRSTGAAASSLNET
jgi:hypothetical protein